MKVRYTVGDLFSFEGSKYVVIDILDLLSSYKVLKADDYGKPLDAEEILFPVNTKGFRKVKKKLDKREQELENTEEFRNNYKPDYENQPELLDNIELVDNSTDFQPLYESLEISIDFETYGNEVKSGASDPDTGEIRLCQVYVPSIDKVLIWDFKKNETGLHILKSKLSDPGCKVFMHNAAFECAWILEKWGIHVTNICDSMILSQVFYAGLQRGFSAIGVRYPHSLKEVAIRELGIELDKENQFFDYAVDLTNEQLNYAANDAINTYKAGRVLLDKCAKEGLMSVVNAEMSAIPAFNVMNRRGLPVCRKTLEDLLQTYSEARDKLAEPWHRLDPRLNLNSPKQLQHLIRDLFGLNFLDNDNKPSTKNPVITSGIIDLREEKLLATTPEKSSNNELTAFEIADLLENLLLYRSVKKDVEYIESYLDAIETVDGIEVIRTRYKQNAENVTGRSSSGSPNMQNIPNITPKKKKLGLKPIRTAFKSPEGMSMVIVDFNGSHTQIFRHVTQDPNLKRAKETGIKEHFYTAQGLLNMQGIQLEPSEIKAIKDDKAHEMYDKINEIYAASKTVFFGSLNLNGAATLQDSFLKKADQLVSFETCKEYIDGWRKFYAKGYHFQRSTIDKANRFSEEFYLQTSLGEQKIGVSGEHARRYAKSVSPDGGRLFVEKFPSKYSNRWEGKGTDIVSFVWLRLEGTIIKSAMGAIHELFCEYPEWNARLFQMTHDEVGVICDKKYELIVADHVNKIMAYEFQKWVPDYEPDSWKPESCLVNNWSEK